MGPSFKTNPPGRSKDFVIQMLNLIQVIEPAINSDRRSFTIFIIKHTLYEIK